MLAGTIFSAYLFYSINEKYKERNNSIIETAIAKVEVKLLVELSKIDLTMESMELFINNSDTIYLPTFKELTTPFLEDLNGILLLGWKPEAKTTTSTGYIVHKVQYPDSLKIHRTEQLNNILLPLIDEALQSRRTVFSEPILELYGKPDTHVFLSMISVYDSTKSSVKGVSFGVFDMDKLVKETLKYELPILDIGIKDHSSPMATLFEDKTNNSLGNKDIHLLNLNAANRVWDVTLGPKSIYIDYPHSYESYFVLLLGLFSSMLLALVLKQRDDYLFRLSQEVRNRTKELEESNKLKETLLREIHHRVKNNLQIASSLMNLQKRRLTDPTMIDAFTSSQGRISAIALIHEKIYEHKDAKAVNLKSYLKVLMKSHQNISPNVIYEIDCPELAIDLDTAVPIALIASELVVNALKHAFQDNTEENRLTIRVKEYPNGEIELAIIDNGAGVPSHFDVKKSKGLGFEIIKKLCRQINGRFSFDSSDNGTTFKILFDQRR